MYLPRPAPTTITHGPSTSAYFSVSALSVTRKRPSVNTNEPRKPPNTRKITPENKKNDEFSRKSPENKGKNTRKTTKMMLFVLTDGLLILNVLDRILLEDLRIRWTNPHFVNRKSSFLRRKQPRWQRKSIIDQQNIHQCSYLICRVLKVILKRLERRLQVVKVWPLPFILLRRRRLCRPEVVQVPAPANVYVQFRPRIRWRKWVWVCTGRSGARTAGGG